MPYYILGVPEGRPNTHIRNTHIHTHIHTHVSYTLSTTQGKAAPGQLAKNWFFSYLGNLVGSVLLAYLIFASGMCVCVCM